MLRFKAFHGADMAAIERQINEWLLKAEPDVKMMDQAVSGTGELTVGFLYDEGFRASERHLTAEAHAIVENALRGQPVLEPIQVDQEQV